ncbi:PD40 domain-containing protein [Pedosphaera parvula]|uniref:WD40 domain protein beta Propeller n=1 Tax=Pedosphaera parvula (strain Ellin514) TaxID=320771 RepID=B9XKH3_PEDPL|nr:PD40 domain-containing protein [Pedosphaera parvula]EEF59643.1 WD40 domain protein beta Propeller [Pedosphaera parvula Ellin514]
MKINFFKIAALALVLSAGTLFAEDHVIPIVKPGNEPGITPPTPIVISGFSDEVAHVLNYDLTVMGFTNVPSGTPNVPVVSGSNNGNVQGQLSYGKTVLFSKAYSGASTRSQAHRLADDVVLKLTSVNGIASTRIAFKVDTGAQSEIYVSDFDGHNPQAVTSDNTIVASPCWFPGRLALCYLTYKLGPAKVFYQNLATGERRNVAQYPGDGISPAVSKDGKVAMVLSKSGSPDLYVCNLDGSGMKQLTHTREDESSPCFSPDGQWICFASKGGERRALSKVSVDGGSVKRIPTAGVSNPSEPDWSPDGKYIVFTSQNSRGFNICVVPAEGGTAIVLTEGEDPSWAPNSRTVVFARRKGGNRVLSLLDVPTKQVKDVSRVSGNSAGNSQPSWAR